MTARYAAAVEAIPEEMRVYWRFHRVESGETLSEIARRYHTTATAIAEANNLEGMALVNDSKLIIPVSPAKAAPKSPVAVSYSKHPAHYTIRKGDTVLSVADDFGVPAEKVRQWNHLKGNSLRAGRSLTVFKSGDGGAEATTETTTNRRAQTSAAPHSPRHAAHASAKSAGKGKHRESADAPSPAAPKHLSASSRASTASPHSKKHRQQD
jgi:membrane-bound lytic murein transglycosylase D